MPAKSKPAPKSHKADGTEKRRWSSAERKDRGHDPRRRGGQSNPSPRRDERDERRPAAAERSERPAYNRDDRRPASADRTARPAFNRSDRPAYGDRTERPAANRGDRPSYGNRAERPAFNRNDRGPSAGRDDRRPSYGDRSERPAYNRDDRRPAAGRDDRRPSYGDRNDRPAYNRDDRRPSYGDRSERPAYNRDDRRPSYGDRSERPAFNRDDRRPATGRDDRRPSSGDRSDRPAYNRDDRRPSYGDRSDRPAFNRDDRRPAAGRDDRRPSSGDRNDRPAYNRDDRRPSYGDRNDRPAYNRDDRRPSYGDRSERPPYNRDDRAERPARRDDRPRTAAHREDRAPVVPADEAPGTTTPLLDDSINTPQEHQHVTITEHTTEASATEPTTGGTFASLGLPPSLVSALTAGGITAPFPIQTATIPDALTGRDVLGRGQTGSGKTLAFGLPMLTRLSGGSSKHPRGLVLVPTRELAMQVTDVLNPLARTLGLSTVLIAGGMSYTPQLRAFQRGVDVVVATPGRLIDLMDQNAVDLTRVETIVLDEADHMADLGFMPAVTQILDTIPAGGQRMLFSATLDGAIDRLVKRYLSNPVTHEVDSGQASVTTMAHHLVYVAPHDKATLTAEIAGRPGRTVVFVRTQRGADRVAEQLRDAGVMAGALHGGLTQGARTRILSVFKDGELPVLVATDVAARGIHVDEVGLVLQVDPPAGPKEYLHRAGRTARAGGTGVVVTLALPHQRREMTRLTSQAGVKPESLTGAPGDAAVADVTGAVRPTGVAVSSADYERLIAPPRSNRRPSGDRGSRGPRSRSGGPEGRRPQRRSFDR